MYAPNALTSYPPYQPNQFMHPQQQSFSQGGFVPPGYVPINQLEGPKTPIAVQPTYGQGRIIDSGACYQLPSCPTGLEYLISIDQLLVKQKVELLEAFTGFETNNKFTIKNGQGQKVFWAIEENDCCTRNMCGPARPFGMKILDMYKNQVIHLNRPLRCSSCLFPCFLQEMEIFTPPGTLIGSIQQNWSLLSPSFDIKNEFGNVVMKIEGPVCTYSMCGEVEFKLITLDNQQVGKISKQWSGLARELFTDADFFGIQFPMDLDVKMKATMLGACFLIDAMYFEKRGNIETDGPGML